MEILLTMISSVLTVGGTIQLKTKHTFMKTKALLILLFFFVGIGLFAACGNKSEKEEGVSYTCPMHPEVIKDEPGECPICKMDLVKK